jgi:redox-sensitive bicupin YhaK (pirin superfamily)
LLSAERPNPLELFQIWLNLPAASKMVPPHFTMFWSGDIPRATLRDSAGHTTEIVLVAGELRAAGSDRLLASAPLAPPPDSWAARADADVAIWTLRMEAGARWTLPAARTAGTRRMLYFFNGASIAIEGERVEGRVAIEVAAERDLELASGDATSELLLLQGRPIGEPVVQHGPFVMNSQAQIVQTFADYRQTQFGGWPWPSEAPVHGTAPQRFARRPDGREDRPVDLPRPAPINA